MQIVCFPMRWLICQLFLFPSQLPQDSMKQSNNTTKIVSSNSTLDVIQLCISNGGKE